MRNVEINGKIVPVMETENGIMETISEFMGNEFSEFTQGFYSECMSDVNEKENILSQEMRSYEMSLEEKTSVLFETMEVLDDIISYMKTAKRINRDEIYKKLVNSRENINAIL